MLSHEALRDEKNRLFHSSRGGASLPVAGGIYWLGLAAAGLFLEPRSWCLVAFFTSGLILPLGMLLQKPFGARLFVPSPLSSLFGIAMIPIALSFAVTIPAFFIDEQLVPLTLSVGMTVHWPAIGWIYGRTGFVVHAIVRTALVCAFWFALPESRFIAIPLVVSLVYAATVAWLVMATRTPPDPSA